MKEEIYDERLYKKMGDIYKIGYLMMIIIDLIMIGLNFLLWKENEFIFMLTIGIIVAMIIYIIIKSMIIRINPLALMKGIDEGILEYRNKTLTHSVIIGLFLILVVQIIFLKLDLIPMEALAIINLIWIIPAIYITVKTLKIKPLNITAKTEINSKRNIIRTFLIFFVLTIFMKPEFNLKNILIKLIGAIIFTIVFTFIFGAYSQAIKGK